MIIKPAKQQSSFLFKKKGGKNNNKLIIKGKYVYKNKMLYTERKTRF